LASVCPRGNIVGFARTIPSTAICVPVRIGADKGETLETRLLRTWSVIAVSIVLVLIVTGCATGQAEVPSKQTPTVFTLPPTWTPTASYTALPLPTLAPRTAPATATRAPGGCKIAFTSDRTGNMDIYIMDADGTNLKRVTDSPEAEQNPSWSPDGRQLAFVAFTKEGGASITRAKIYLVNVDGSGRRILIDDRMTDLFPAWSPDGQRIAYEVPGEIRTVLANGNSIQTLATSSDSNVRQPKWSPDGTAIAYWTQTLPAVAKARSMPLENKIYVIDAQGLAKRFLTYGYSPSWSPDGSRIAIVSDESGQDQIFVINSDGANTHQLTSGPAVNIAPDWSPDGSQIVFSSIRDGNWEIYVMDADGSNPRRLTHHPAGDGYPVWQR
jgi:TolB protein